MEKDLQIPDSTGLTFEKVWLMMQKSDERFEQRLQKEREDRIVYDKEIEKERIAREEKAEKERIAREEKAKKERIAREEKAEVERIAREKERIAHEEKLEAFRKEDKEITKKLNEMIFGLGNNLGKITEDYFYNTVASDKKVGGIQYDFVSRNLKMEGKKLNGEYDIVLINSNRLLVIEVKQKPHIKSVEKFVNKQLPIFKKLFPHYANYTIYGAIAGMTFEENVLDYAKENGLYILTQNQDSKNMQLLNADNFAAKEF